MAKGTLSRQAEELSALFFAYRLPPPASCLPKPTSGDRAVERDHYRGADQQTYKLPSSVPQLRTP